MKQLTSQDVYNLPSFKSFCRDIGIDTDLPIQDLKLHLDSEDFAKITVEYTAVSKEAKE